MIVVEQGLASIYEIQLESLGFELLDLGCDLESEEHLYYIFEIESGIQVSEELLLQADVERFIDALK